MTQRSAETQDVPGASWPRRRHGEGGCDLFNAGALDGAKANPWKANYHTSLAMMNVVNLLTMPSHKP